MAPGVTRVREPESQAARAPAVVIQRSATVSQALPGTVNSPVSASTTSLPAQNALFSYAPPVHFLSAPEERVQRTKLADRGREKDGADPEADGVHWKSGRPYIADDKEKLHWISVEMVNNQRGERGSEHKVTFAHLQMAVRKTVKASAGGAATKIFRSGATEVAKSPLLKVVVKGGVPITAFYTTERDAQGSIPALAWPKKKAELPTFEDAAPTE